MCGEKKETIEHLLNECVELGEGDESREEILNEDGRGIGMDEEGWVEKRDNMWGGIIVFGKLLFCYCFELLFYLVS
jgi:hypothetical protein